VFCISLGLLYFGDCFSCFFYDLVLSILAKMLAGKSIPEMTYLVSSGTLNLNSINHARVMLMHTLFTHDKMD